MTSPAPQELVDDLDASFPDFVDAHGSMVLTLATRLTDPTTGQDITQEVFLRAYRALKSYTPDRILRLDTRPWIATITRNLVRNEYRRRDRRPTVPLVADRRRAPNNSEGAVDEAEALDRVNSLLVWLTDAQREAVVLRHIVGLPIRQVALTMACPEGTAKSHVSRGLERLRNEVDRLAEVERER